MWLPVMKKTLIPTFRLVPSRSETYLGLKHEDYNQIK